MFATKEMTIRPLNDCALSKPPSNGSAAIIWFRPKVRAT